MASKWKTLNKALELQAQHRSKAKHELHKRANELRAEGLTLKVISERLGLGLEAVRTLLGLGSIKHERVRQHGLARRAKKKEARSARGLLTSKDGSGTTDSGTEQ